MVLSMILEQGVATSILLVVALGLLSVVLSCIHTLFSHPLAKYPGPLWGRLSRTFLMYHTHRGNVEKVQLELHKKHGPIVRFAPDELSISDPQAVKVIYGAKSGFTKTDFYQAFANGGPFPEQDVKVHASMRKTVNHLYTMTNVLRYESLIDICSQLFLQRVGEHADEGVDIDIGEWVQMYAFDVIGEIFFGNQFGFMRDRKDFGGLMQAGETVMGLFSLCSVTPLYARKPLLALSLVLPRIRRGLESVSKVQGYAQQCVLERQKDRESSQRAVNRTDFLENELEIQDQGGPTGNFGIKDVCRDATDALLAGADTTAIAFRTAIYHLLRSPDALSKLQTEIDSATVNGELGTAHVAYSEALKLPYLTAVIKESLRIHPAVGTSLPRYVPRGGSLIAGHEIPEGTKVGVNAAVVHLDTSVFGDDAASFNPDRWLEPEASTMEGYMLHFGGGTRTCLGKNISMCELYKLIPELFRNFRMSLVDPQAEWRTHNSFFNKQFGVLVRVTRRNT